MKPETLKRCIYWQHYVMRHTTDPAQRERCRRAIEKLTAQLEASP